MDWKQLLVYLSGSVEEELLLRMEYVIAENRILRDRVKGRVQLSDTERRTLAEMGKKLSKQALEEVGCGGVNGPTKASIVILCSTLCAAASSCPPALPGPCPV